MKVFGLIGYPLSHSFSKKYFTEKFEKEHIANCRYELFEIEHIDLFPALLKEQGENLKGLNVTIPYKEVVIPFLDEVHDSAKRINAVNVIKPENGRWIGYNSDYFGFKSSLLNLIGDKRDINALILGTGGASKAVRTVLEDLKIPFQYVSRNGSESIWSYDQLNKDAIQNHQLIINTTPLGMSPNIDSCPAIPYEAITNNHYLFDLVYNPEETLFMKQGITNGASVSNGLDMLIGQAEKAWEIWNN